MGRPTAHHKSWGRQLELKALALTKFTLPQEATSSKTGSWAFEDGSQGSKSGEDLSKLKTTTLFILFESQVMWLGWGLPAGLYSPKTRTPRCISWDVRSPLELVLRDGRGIVASTLECAACSQAWGCQQEQVLGSGLGPVGSLSWYFFGCSHTGEQHGPEGDPGDANLFVLYSIRKIHTIWKGRSIWERSGFAAMYMEAGGRSLGLAGHPASTTWLAPGQKPVDGTYLTNIWGFSLTSDLQIHACTCGHIHILCKKKKNLETHISPSQSRETDQCTPPPKHWSGRICLLPAMPAGVWAPRKWGFPQMSRTDTSKLSHLSTLQVQELKRFDSSNLHVTESMLC